MYFLLEENGRPDFVSLTGTQCRSLTKEQVDHYWNQVQLGPNSCLDLLVEGQDIQYGGLSKVEGLVYSLGHFLREAVLFTANILPSTLNPPVAVDSNVDFVCQWKDSNNNYVPCHFQDV